MTPLTVVILKGYPRLSETFIAQELLGLEQAGHRLALISMRRPTDPTVHAVHRQIAAPVHYLPEYLHEEPLRVARGLWRVLRAGLLVRALGTWLGDLSRDMSRNRFRRLGQAAVLVAEMPAGATQIYAHFIHTPSSVARYASLMSGLPWCCSAHAKDIWTSPDWELADKLRAARWAVTCTRTGWERLSALAPVPDRVHLVYHGLDLDRFPAKPAGCEARDGRSEGHAIRLLAVGRAVEKKGFDTLIAALARLPSEIHWRLGHIGGGGLTKALRKQAEVAGIADRITWHGARDQSFVLDAYRNADIFVLPCRVAGDGDRDGLPNVLVEAQSQRLACISTTVGGVPELIEDGETGVLVPPDDVSRLAGAILQLTRDTGRRETLARAGERRVRSRFCARNGIAAISALLATGRPAGETGAQGDAGADTAVAT